MRVAIDRLGRLVVPKPVREQLGLVAGTELELSVVGAGLTLEPVSGAGFVDDDGFLVIPASGEPTLTADDVRELRLADQR